MFWKVKALPLNLSKEGISRHPTLVRYRTDIFHHFFTPKSSPPWPPPPAIPRNPGKIVLAFLSRKIALPSSAPPGKYNKGE
jgi:hypothetical protein